MRNKRSMKKSNKVRLIQGKTSSAPKPRPQNMPRKIYLAGTRK